MERRGKEVELMMIGRYRDRVVIVAHVYQDRPGSVNDEVQEGLKIRLT